MGMIPKLGLWPYTPQNDDGTRIDPPMSEPVASGVVSEASEAPDPPLEFAAPLRLPHRQTH